MTLLTEQTIGVPTAEAVTQALIEPAQAEASPAAPSTHDAKEMRVELHNLRTELMRTSANMARNMVFLLIGLAMLLLAAVFLLRQTNTPAAPSEPIKPDPTLTAQLSELSGAFKNMDARFNSLSQQLSEQGKAIEQVGQQASKAQAAVASVGKLDCNKLPSNAKSTEVDFSIQFQANSSKILPASEATLEGIAKMLALVPNACILIEGHADATGTAEKNITVSKDRANAVLDYIVSKTGMERSRLVAIGKGSSSPPVSGDAADPANRRVIFKLVSAGGS